MFIDHGVTVCENLAILAYLDAAATTQSLFGNSPIETARIWQCICDCDGNLWEPVGKNWRPLFRGKTIEAADQIKEAAKSIRDEMALYDTTLQENDWVGGDVLTAGDLIAFPIIM